MLYTIRSIGTKQSPRHRALRNVIFSSVSVLFPLSFFCLLLPVSGFGSSVENSILSDNFAHFRSHQTSGLFVYLFETIYAPSPTDDHLREKWHGRPRSCRVINNFGKRDQGCIFCEVSWLRKANFSSRFHHQYPPTHIDRLSRRHWSTIDQVSRIQSRICTGKRAI